MRLRFATADDAPGIHAIMEPLARDTPINFSTEAAPVEAYAERLAAAGAMHPWIVATADPGVAGFAFARAAGDRPGERWTVEVGIGLAPAARGQRLGDRLYRALLAILRAQGYRTITAAIVVPNAASEALHRAHGFRPAGVIERAGYKLGAWRDLSWWQLHFGDPGTPPGELVPSTELAHLLEDA